MSQNLKKEKLIYHEIIVETKALCNIFRTINEYDEFKSTLKVCLK